MIRYCMAATAIGLLMVQPAFADYSAGVTAYERNDYGTALRQFQSSADQGDADSQYMLGELYARGQGVNQDFAQAHKWYNLAAARGRPGAAEARDALASRMTGEQIARAQQEASAFRVASSPEPRSSGLPEQYSVANVQAALNRLGYDAGSVDGAMGPRTRTAIRQYQAASGLSQTGEPTHDLYQRLRASLGGGAPAATATAARTETGPVGGTATTTASATVVSDIQSRLRQTGYQIDAVTGNMDSQTRSAIMDYQLRNGLSATGAPSESLLAHMRAGGDADVQSRTEIVRNLQQELNRRGYDAGPADGAFGPKTRTAIRTYQSDAGLRVDGEPSAQLLARLRTDTSTTASAETMLGSIRSELRGRGYEVGSGDQLDGTTREAIRSYQRDAGLSVTGEANTTLLTHLQDPARQEPNTNRGLVRQIQTELRNRGFTISSIDGIPGPATRSAIQTYQKNMNMAVDGQPSVELLVSLQQSSPGAGQPSQSAIVGDIERELQTRGYTVGTVDGTLDAQSGAAIRRYQQDAGLTVDGQASEALLAHIRGHNVQARPMSSGEAAGEAAGQLIRRMMEQRQ